MWTLDLVAGASSSCQWLFSQGHTEDRDAGRGLLRELSGLHLGCSPPLFSVP